MNIQEKDILESQLSRLEQEVSDDFHLLEQGGVGYFSTEELKDLYLNWSVRYNTYRRYHYLNLGIGINGITTLILAIVIYKMQLPEYARKLFWCSPLSFALFFIGRWWLHHKFNVIRQQRNYGKMLQTELQKRRKYRGITYF